MGARPIHCALALTSTLLGAPLARGATGESYIPAPCGSRADFDAEVQARLGRSARPAEVDVTIVPRGDGYVLRVALGAEQRVVEDPSCHELFRAAVVIAVSMLLERRQDARAVAASPPAAPSSAAPSAPPPRVSARRVRPDFSVALGAGLGLGTLPKPVPTFELEGKALWRFVGVGANVRYLLAAERRDETQQGVDLSALGAGVTGIFRPSLAWEARLGFAAQRLSGTGVGTSSGSSAAVWAAGPTLGLGWAPLRRGAYWVGVGAEGQLNLARGRFEILNYSGELTGQRHVAYRVPWLAAGAFVRLGWVW